ncbi:MAG: hypothetical protein ABI681_12270 [Gemmatimonadales bacterium]
MRRILTCSTLLLAALGPASLRSQTAAGPPPPPAVLFIGREEVKVGMRGVHADFEAKWPAAYTRYSDPTNYLAMTSNTGPSEAWFLVGYPSFAAMEKDNDRASANAPMSAELGQLSKGDAEFISNNTGIVLQLVSGMTYGGNVNIPTMRYMEVITYRVRPGHDADFGKAAALYRDAATKGKSSRPWALYRTVSGAPAGTYLVLLPMKSLAVWDAGDADDKAIMGAMGSDGAMMLKKLISDGVATASSQLFEFSPKMSYVSKEWKAANPSFWK